MLSLPAMPNPCLKQQLQVEFPKCHFSLPSPGLVQTQPQDCCGSTRQPKRFPEEADAFVEEIIHFLMLLKYRQKALGALLSDPLPCISHGCSQGGVKLHVLNLPSTAWIGRMPFSKPSNFTILGIPPLSLGHTIAATLWGQGRGWRTFGHDPG